MCPSARARWFAARHLVAGAVGLVLSAVGCASSSEGGEAEATILLSRCEGVGVAELQCGVLRVEENREQPNGHQIELEIVVAPSTSRTPASDPVFFLAGGPGQGAAALAPMIVSRFDAIRRERDMVFVDLRGTGGSGPLRCDVEDPDDLGELLGASFDVTKLDGCVAEFAAAGVDPTQYTTAAMIDDLDEVRAGLGYGQVNLLGISYGTLAAQVYMRRHASRVRSAVLDGVVPTDSSVSLAMPSNFERALKLAFADCREDRGCAAAYPGLERKLAQVLRDLDENRALEAFNHPRTGAPTRVEISREGFVHVLGGTLYSSQFAALVPLLIERAYVGDWGPVAAVALRTAQQSKTVSTGLYLSVACAEELAGVDEAARREATAGLEFFDDHPLEQLEQACARWPHAEIDAGFHEPISSDVPTLLLSGRYDPVTPPKLAEQLAERLGDARHVTVDAVSHGVWHNGCAPELIADFFAAPDPAALDSSCLDGLARPGVFLSPNGPWTIAKGQGADAPVLDAEPESDAESDAEADSNSGSALAQGEPLGGRAEP
ncbi:alpha/beta hydrolase [Enhygromyxa salina]|nr:alpha/beta hydrolase [Enhygromyxa salina]